MLKAAWDNFIKAFSFDYSVTGATPANNETPVICVHPLTHDPTAAWNQISKTQRLVKINAKPPEGKVPPNKLRVVCMSDTHALTKYIPYEVPDGDIFIHAGDFTNCGGFEDVVQFNDWLGTLPHKHKIVIAGNHEITFDSSFTHPLWCEKSNLSHNSTKHASGALINESPVILDTTLKDEAAAVTATATDGSDSAHPVFKSFLTNCTYIEDKLIEVYGLRIYGSPWQPEFGSWAFNLKRGEACLAKWNNIPENIDILITHGPPIGHGDLCRSGVRAGCVELLSTVQQRVKPKYHIFGHIHEGYGITSDGRIIYINASTCNLQYKPCNPAIVFDMPLPEGIEKEVV